MGNRPIRKARRKAGRPHGRIKPHRPVIGARVSQEFYDQIKAEAEGQGRTIAQQLIWRADYKANAPRNTNEVLHDLVRQVSAIKMILWERKTNGETTDTQGPAQGKTGQGENAGTTMA